MNGIDKLRKSMSTPTGEFNYFSLAELNKEGRNVEELPFSIRILLENIIRNFNNNSFNKTHLNNILAWNSKKEHGEIPYLPARVLMQDFTGVPSVVDIASIRSEVARRNKNPRLINPQVSVDLIIDHSVQVDFSELTTPMNVMWIWNINAIMRDTPFLSGQNHRLKTLMFFLRAWAFATR